MPVPTQISDLSKVASENSPQGTETVKGTIDDYLRAAFAFIRQSSDLTVGPTVTLTSAATVNIGFAASANILITGTTTITAFDTIGEGTLRWVIFAGALTLTHNATSLQLPGAANITTVAGDVALFKSLGSGNWKCMLYAPMNGQPPVAVSIAKGGTGATTAAAALTNLGAMPRAGGDFTGAITALGVCARAYGGSNGGQLQMQRASDNTVSHFWQAYGADANPYVRLVSPAGEVFRIDTPGNVVAQGSVSAPVITQTSDERKKRRWQRLPGDFIQRLAGIRKTGIFHWKKGGAAGVGVGAQSLELILPEAVHTDEAGMKTVNYGGAAMVSVVELARALVDLQVRVGDLEAR